MKKLKRFFENKNRALIQELKGDMARVKNEQEKLLWHIENEPIFKVNEKVLFKKNDKLFEGLIIKKPVVVNRSFFTDGYLTIRSGESAFGFKYKVFVDNKIENVFEDKLLKSK